MSALNTVSPPSTTGRVGFGKWVVSFAGKFQERLLGRGPFTDYLIMLILPSIPVVVSALIGIAHTQTVRIGSSQAICAGYWDRKNWISLIALLPIALWTVRITSDLLFWQTARFKKFQRIPDLVPGGPDQSARDLGNAWKDGRNFLASLFLAAGIQLIDMWGTLVPYVRSLHGAIHVSRVPARWDWALWFLSNTADRSLYWKDMGLMLVAYTSQFGMALLGISLVILLVRHNIFYLKSIYLRSRAIVAPDRPMVPIDLDAPDLRFGFHSLFMVFNVQLLLLAVAGAYTLISRSSNRNTSALSTCLANLGNGEFKFSEFWGAVFGNLSSLFPTVGQRIFPAVWIVMFVIVLLPAFVKLLPIPFTFRKNEIDAKDYLREFLPPDSQIALQTNDLKNTNDVDETAAKFSRQSFWPVSQTSAEFFSVVAFFVFLLILAPVFTWPPTVGQLLFYAMLLVMSFIASAALFAVFRYMLRTIDPRLVGKKG